MLNLSPIELEELKTLHKKEKNKRRADRIKMILLLNKGFSQKEVSELLLLDEDTITTWKKKFQKRTDNTTWLDDHYVPYFGKLSTVEMSRIRSYCINFKVSTKEEINNFITTNIFVKYDLSGLQKLLFRIGVSHQKLHRLPGKADTVKQAVFAQKYYEQVDQLLESEAIMFIDAVHPQHNSIPSKIWSPAGKQRWIQSNTGRERININGAYNPISQEVIVRQDSTINGISTIKLFEQITKYYSLTKSKIILFSDNGRSNKCTLIKEWLAKQSFIKVIYLPPYSPNLNLIERLWKFMKKTVISTHFYPSFSEFKKGINSFFDNIDDYKSELRTFIGQKLQLFDEQSLASL